jgi:hypothetical protein
VFDGRVLRPMPSTLRVQLTAILMLGCLLAPAARAHQPTLLLPAPGIVTECREDVRLFQSLASGTVDYCRAHLRYVPGALDCYRVIDRVCWVFLPATSEWTDTYSPRARIPFPCPDAPVPPVCRRLDLQ